MVDPLRLLMIEDSEDDAALLLRVLRRAGYALHYRRVETREGFDRALRDEPWDLVLADYLLPGFSAEEALRQIRSFDLDLPFIIVSGTISEEMAISSLKAGANDFVTKGKLARLVPAIERELREALDRLRRREAERSMASYAARADALALTAAKLSETLDVDSVIDTVARLAGNAFGIPLAGTFLYHRHSGKFQLAGPASPLRAITPLLQVARPPHNAHAALRQITDVPAALAAAGVGEPTMLRTIAIAELRRHGQLLGKLVIGSFDDDALFGAEDLALLRSLADQASIALDNAQLFSDLQQANMDLELAYDATLEGWVHGLDLRDKETEGHTLRVTALTVRLAQALGLGGDELIHIRRGALLHDIGKMGIPDAILLKPGKLTAEEWEIMRMHPVYAYEWLRPIPFLRPALDIPYCHHERWDGSGYPQGLRGEQIPLAARLFAVVDVWDAMRSDRPYKQAQPADEVCAHLSEAAGRLYDPAAVAAFLAIVADER